MEEVHEATRYLKVMLMANACGRWNIVRRI